MLFNASKRLQQSSRRLHQDLEEMEKLHRLTPSTIRFIANGRDSTAPGSYIVEVGITSFTDVTRQGIPLKCENFRMGIHLPIDYPERKSPEFEVYPAPFHPHFKRITPWLMGEGYGIWIDPHDQDVGLGTLVLRIVHSLRYEPEYIDLNSAKIGNREALEWYSYWLSFFNQDTKTWFPSDRTFLPDSLPIAQKKFDIEPRKFVLGESIPRTQRDRSFAMTASTKKTFQIVETTPPYLPTVATLPQGRNLSPSDFRGSCQTYQLYIEPRATSEIFERIAWGKSSPVNRVEQGGILLGYARRDEATGMTFGIVENAIAGDSAIVTSAYLKMNHATWKKMIDRVDMMLDSNPNKDLQIIGWYHTHPNQLDVFMSETDVGTQMRFFSNDWQFAIVLNPHKKLWRAFHGKNAEECKGFLITG